MIVHPKKRLGQHFLKDHNIAQKIVNCLDENMNHTVIEIGPGMGILTKYLIPKSADLYVVEIDNEAIAFLKMNFPRLQERLIHDDFLTLDLNKNFGKPLTLIGNFPYNISSRIFFKVLENKDLVSEVVCMIQKEVAERISAGPGSKTYGILSVLLQAFYKIEYLFTVNETVFDPPPKVKSGVIKITRNNTTHLDCDEKLFFRVVKTGFNQRRKTLRNSLKSLLNGKTFELDIFNKRPEQLGVADFVFLTNFIENTYKKTTDTY